MPSRRQLVIGYLLLLACSTVVRWRMSAFEPRGRWEVGGGADDGMAVLVITDAASPTPEIPRLVTEVSEHPLFTERHRVKVVGTRVDPVQALGSGVNGPVHLVAFGTGGAPAILFAARAPDQVKSLALIDAEGIEEFDLLGEHHLNQVLRRAQVILFGLVRWGIPHFGALDQRPLFADRSRALLATDRRGVRAALATWQGPTLILDRSNDRAMLRTAAEEARLVPQSYTGPAASVLLLTFLAAVDEGVAPTRATATPERIVAATRPFDAGGLASAQGTSLIVVLVLLALATLLSEDLACITAGVLAARGSIPLWPGILACYIGIVIGDQLLYLLGRSAGRALVTRAPLKWILSTERLDQAYEWFRTHGMKVVLTSRLLPGTRSTVYVAAGILRAGFVRFALWLVVIGAVWTPALVGLSYEATRRGRSLIEALPGPTWPWALGAVIGGTLLIRSLVIAATPEGRAGLRARWRGVKAAG